METASITTASKVPIKSLLRNAPITWTLHEPFEGRVAVVDERGSRAFVYEDPDTGKVFVDYSDIQLAKALLVLMADRSDFIVDNDFGDVMSGDAFAARVRANPDWDWMNAD